MIAEVWMCGAFQRVQRPFEPYRCTEPYGHAGQHQAVIDGETVAEWSALSRPAADTKEETP